MTVTVVIPAFNEEGNVGRLIHEIFRVVPREMLSAVIVVNDGSSDHRNQIPNFDLSEAPLHPPQRPNRPERRYAPDHSDG